MLNGIKLEQMVLKEIEFTQLVLEHIVLQQKVGRGSDVIISTGELKDDNVQCVPRPAIVLDWQPVQRVVAHWYQIDLHAVLLLCS